MKHTFHLQIDEKTGGPVVTVETETNHILHEVAAIPEAASTGVAAITLEDIMASYGKMEDAEWRIVGFREPEVGEHFLAARNMQVVKKYNNRTSGKRLIVVEN